MYDEKVVQIIAGARSQNLDFGMQAITMNKRAITYFWRPNATCQADIISRPCLKSFSEIDSV